MENLYYLPIIILQLKDLNCSGKKTNIEYIHASHSD